MLLVKSLPLDKIEIRIKETNKRSFCITTDVYKRKICLMLTVQQVHLWQCLHPLQHGSSGHEDVPYG